MTKPSRPRRYTKKLSLAAGSLSALAFGAQEAEADIVYRGSAYSISGTTNDPIGTTPWDVDGVDGADFLLTLGAGRIFLGSNNTTALNGSGFVRKTTADPNFFANKLTPLAGIEVEAFTTASPYEFAASGNRLIFDNTEFATNPVNSDLTIGNNFVGFKFSDSVGTKFGWARFNLAVPDDGVFTIAEWAYEDSGGEIEVGAAPEPSSFALMAAGAAGVLAWKRRKRKAVVSESETDNA